MNDLDLEKVLKSAGLREKPPADVERAVLEHLRGEWRETVAQRGRRSRQRTGFALAAGLLAAAIGVWVIAPRFSDAPVAVASVTSRQPFSRISKSELVSRVAMGPVGRSAVFVTTIVVGGPAAPGVAGGIVADATALSPVPRPATVTETLDLPSPTRNLASRRSVEIARKRRLSRHRPPGRIGLQLLTTLNGGLQLPT